jgi:hypothetical protein
VLIGRGTNDTEQYGALSTELRKLKLAAGFEPATTGLPGEVSDIFTTDLSCGPINLETGQGTVTRGIEESSLTLAGLP